MISKYNILSSTAEGKLASLEEFKIQKEDLMRKFAEMEEELKQKEQDHKDEIYRLERKQVIDKDMWVASSQSAC